VTQLLPKTVSDDEFAKIFATRSRQSRVSEVLSTLSQTVHDLEEPLSRMSIANQETQQQQHQQQQHSSQEPADDGTARLSLRHADGSETNLHFQFNPLAGQYPAPAARAHRR
jgi:pyridoxine/pyridoxamine 5'-phosphate oxidase